MKHSRMAVTVLGDGGWGTTLAIHLSRLGHRVTWWGAFPDYFKTIDRRRENVKFLPGVRIPRNIRIVWQLPLAVRSAEMVVVAVPSQHLRKVVRRLRGTAEPRSIFVSVAKGLELGTMRRMSEIIREELGERVPLAVLSGPNIASEIAKGQPASSVVASGSAAVAATVQAALKSERLRIYTTRDVVGVELGGALKNPIAIAAGIGDGLGYGSNAKAALVTRGVVEMARLGKAMGAQTSTFGGLSGLGDLVTTCLSGRNHWLGEQLGRGRSLKSILASTPMVIEGVETAKAAVKLARRHRVELPIIEQVHAVLFQGRSLERALHALMTRTDTSETL